MMLAMWRFLYSVCPATLLIKDTKAHGLFYCHRYSSAETEADKRTKVENIFVAPPYCQCNVCALMVNMFLRNEKPESESLLCTELVIIRANFSHIGFQLLS
jgi:hypothetical protein